MFQRIVRDQWNPGRWIAYTTRSIRVFLAHELSLLADLFAALSPSVLELEILNQEAASLAKVLAIEHWTTPPPQSLEDYFSTSRPWRLAQSVAVASVCASTLLPVVEALPTGYQNVAGSVQFEASGSTLNVTTGANKAIATYQSFNVAGNETVNFNLPSRNAAILNRVTGGDPSQIMGRVNSNGQVYLVNPAGIVFGQGAQVNVGALHASTLNIEDQDFLAGQNKFFREGFSGAIINQGNLQGQAVTLIGSVINNQGSIMTPGGSVNLAVGDRVTMVVDEGLSVQVTVDEGLKSKVEGYTAAIQNSGTVSAENGFVSIQTKLQDGIYDKALNLEGVIEAQGFGHIQVSNAANALAGLYGTLNVSGQQAGLVEITSTGPIWLSGDVLAHGATLGGQISVASSNTIDLSGRMDAGSEGQGGVITLHSGARIMANSSHVQDVSGALAGRIHNDAQGIFSSATYWANASQGQGGQIDFGGGIGFLGAAVSASGLIGGGQVRVGGEHHGGKNLVFDEVRNAPNTFISQGTTLTAKTTGVQGDGGTVVVWSDGQTQMYGNINTQPGSQVGTGGFVEISGGETVQITSGLVQSGVGNRMGQILLDPKNLGDYILDVPLREL